ncbi:nuclear transport factor 2 family protein [Streptomyces sp. JNUCC 63]
MQHKMTAPGWQPLLDRMASETDPIRRRNLDVVGRHVVEEVAGNLPKLMETLVAEPVYSVWGASDSVGPHGHDEVLAWYQALAGSGRNRLDYVLHRVVVDENTVVTEGDFHYAFQGDELEVGGHTEQGEMITPDGRYLVVHRAVVLWPISAEGLIEGEHIYAGERHRVVRALHAGERPELGRRGQAPA